MRESAELVMDLQDLLAKGWSDEQIAEELELDYETLDDLLACLRRRHDDHI
jgi:orotate phosphoribosyltransferase-like protein